MVEIYRGVARVIHTPFWFPKSCYNKLKYNEQRCITRNFSNVIPPLKNSPVQMNQKSVKPGKALGTMPALVTYSVPVKRLSTNMKDVFPKTPEELETLPGIGPYTAGAVASFAFRKDAAILDTNAERVLTRFFALPPERQTSRFLWDIAHRVTPKGKAYLFNQAIMDVGATICVARTPRCTACPLRSVCKSVTTKT